MDNNKFVEIARQARRRLPQVGDVYNHFKGNKIYIVALGFDTETTEPVIVYNHDNTIWVRPLDMFLSAVDKTKYPDVKQYYRFERELPWNIEETPEFKSLVEDLSYAELFENSTPDEIAPHVLRHFYL